MRRVFQVHEAFYADRPAMDKSNDLAFLIKAVMEEASELADDVPEYMSRRDYFLQETADVMLFCLAILRKLGADPEEVVLEKIARNQLKYPAYRFNGSTPPKEAVFTCKRVFKRDRGNVEFYTDGAQAR